MKKLKPLTNLKGEVREISSADLKGFRTAGEMLPASVRQKVGVRGSQKTPTKERITIRLSPEVVARFRATGKGWQSRMNAALQDWLEPALDYRRCCNAPTPFNSQSRCSFHLSVFNALCLHQLGKDKVFLKA
ncbi:MAG: hypothetical protein EBX42_12225 [Betaproteobacteria bacterium]|nr:hypothetical protein [Betaproteobacteria bacterium]